MIFITGAARSGTSLTTRILQAHGCNLGRPINSLYENTGIREGVLKPYLRSIGADPLGQRNLPDTDRLPPLPALCESFERHIPGHEPRAYKDAKLTLVWPVFATAFPGAKWVLVRRDRERIVDSCLRTQFMYSFREREPWRKWVIEHEKRFTDMKEKLAIIEIWPDKVVMDAASFAPVCAFLGLEFDLEATMKAIDAKAWHNDSASPVLQNS